MSNGPPEKRHWTDADFESMSWHDVLIHAVGFEADRLLFDIDYQSRWVHPEPGEKYFKFWMAPATLVFEGVSEAHFDFTPSLGVIMDLERFEPMVLPDGRPTWRWRINCLAGDIEFRAAGYRQYARRPEVLWSKQSFSVEERGGLSFAWDPSL